MARRDIWAVVPTKRFDGAKQRLATMFPANFRRELAAVMAEDVLAALSGAQTLSGILVVTDDPDAAALGRRYGAEIFADHASSGHTAAVIAGSRALLASGRRGMLALPGDIPTITETEIDHLLASHGEPPSFTIVPAHDRRGSNAIVMTPPDAIALAFGNDSFLPHLQAARDCGIEPTIVSFAGIGLDVDEPADLFAVAALNQATRTHRFLQGSAVFTAALVTESCAAQGHAND